MLLQAFNMCSYEIAKTGLLIVCIQVMYKDPTNFTSPCLAPKRYTNIDLSIQYKSSHPICARVGIVQLYMYIYNHASMLLANTQFRTKTRNRT